MQCVFLNFNLATYGMYNLGSCNRLAKNVLILAWLAKYSCATTYKKQQQPIDRSVGRSLELRTRKKTDSTRSSFVFI